MQLQLDLYNTKLNDAIYAYKQGRFGTPVNDEGAHETPLMGDSTMGNSRDNGEPSPERKAEVQIDGASIAGLTVVPEDEQPPTLYSGFTPN